MESLDYKLGKTTMSEYMKHASQGLLSMEYINDSIEAVNTDKKMCKYFPDCKRWIPDCTIEKIKYCNLYRQKEKYGNKR